MIDKIVDANDMAKDMAKTVKGFEEVTNAQELLERTLLLNKMVQKEGKSPPVWAYVNRGRWLGKCECGGVEYVAPNVKFMCFSCGNAVSGGLLREVIFPENKDEIEEILLSVNVRKGIHPRSTHRALTAYPYQGNTRDWHYSESVDDLRIALEVSND